MSTERPQPNVAKGLQRDYWLIRSTPADTTTSSDVERCAASHIGWLLGLEAAGTVLLSGPLLSGPGVAPGAGITIIRADTEQQAVNIANTDPFVTAGLRTFEVFRWRINEGSVDVRLFLGTGTYVWR